jgi:D-alanyl-D-alanine carboxypeptidase, serine-type, PBP4 family
MLRRFLHTLIFLCLLVQVQGQNTAMFRKKAYEHASVGICVLDLSNSKRIAGLNEQRSLQPASVVKLVTTAAALEILGPDCRFETRIEYTGSLVNGVLDGDLWIRGGGDPSLGSRQVDGDSDAFLDQWVKAVKIAGIKTVKGRIIADASIFDDEPVSPYWLWEDMGNYYAAGIYGLGVYDNSFQLELRSAAAGSRPEILSVRPELPLLTIDNHLKAVNNNLDSAYFYGVPYQWARSLFGTMPSNRSRFVIKGDIPDPPFFLAGRFGEELEKNGVRVEGNPVSLRQLADADRLSALPAKILEKTYSIPLSQMIRIIQVKSDNLYTEYLLRHLALSVYGKPATAKDGIKVVRDFWQKKGLDVSALSLSDACGLSPNDRVSPAFLAQMLRYMSEKSPYASVYKSAFPWAGKEGSVAGFLKGTALEGKLRLKSGSVQSVTSYAGYYEQNGKSYVVVLMVNNADADRFQIRKDMEHFLLAL